MTRRTKGMLLVVFGALLWGGSGVAAQFVLQNKGFSAEWLVVVRMLLSGIILLSLDGITHFGDIFSIWKSRYDSLQLIAFALIGMLGVQYTYFAAIKAGNAATATILQYLMPIVIVLWTVLRYRRRPQLRELFCTALAILGTLLLVTHGSLSSLAISPPALFWGVLSAFAAAFYTVQPKYLLGHWRSPLVIGWGMLLGGLAFLPVCPPWDFTGIWDKYACIVFLYIIIFGTIIAFWAYLESVKYIQPTETSTLASIEPLSAIVLSALLLNVPFGLVEILGAICIMSTVFVLARK